MDIGIGAGVANSHPLVLLDSLRCERIVVDIECTVYEKVANQKQCRFGGSQC